MVDLNTGGGFLIPDEMAHMIAHGGTWIPRDGLQAWKARWLPEWLTTMWWPVKLRWQPYLRNVIAPSRYASVYEVRR